MEEVNVDKKYLIDKRPKRNQENKIADMEFIKFLLVEDPFITATHVRPRLLEHIKERGDDYTLTVTTIYHNLQKARSEMAIHARGNIGHHIQAELAIIEEQILICIEEISRRLTERKEETIEIEEISASDLSGLSLEETFVLSKLQSKLSKRKVKFKKILPGSDLRDAMELLHMWVNKKNKLLGLDAPKKIHKKTEKEIRKETFDYQELEIKVRQIGGNTELLKQLFDDTQRVHNTSSGEAEDEQG